jgi:hypothetical protein
MRKTMVIKKAIASIGPYRNLGHNAKMNEAASEVIFSRIFFYKGGRLSLFSRTVRYT